MTVKNLRKGLRLLGAEIAEDGAYNDDVLQAHTQYAGRLRQPRQSGNAKHVVAPGESLGAIAASYGLPTWKYLYETNKNVVGENPDLLRQGTELQIPGWDTTSGDEKIAAKGADAMEYAPGSHYRYPWVPFSATFVDEDDRTRTGRNGKELHYEIRDRATGNVLQAGDLTDGDELETLLPDSQYLGVAVDGLVCDPAMKG